MRDFEKGIARIDGHTRLDVMEQKIDLLIKEVIYLGRIIEIITGNYVIERQKKAEKGGKNGVPTRVD